MDSLERMLKLAGVITESDRTNDIEREIELIKSNIQSIEKALPYADHGAYGQDTAELSKLYSRLNQLKKELSKGETKPYEPVKSYSATPEKTNAFIKYVESTLAQDNVSDVTIKTQPWANTTRVFISSVETDLSPYIKMWKEWEENQYNTIIVQPKRSPSDSQFEILGIKRDKPPYEVRLPSHYSKQDIDAYASSINVTVLDYGKLSSK